MICNIRITHWLIYYPTFHSAICCYRCLGPNGFTVCNEDALWILTKRSGKTTYSLVSLLNESPAGLCLQQKYGRLSIFSTDSVIMGSCTTKSAKSWDFDFLDQKHVKLSNRGQCLLRGKYYRSAMSLQACRLGEFTSLVYHPANLHKNGFYLKSADGYCFDGAMFKKCSILSTTNSDMLWGIGVKYTSWTGQESRYIFDFTHRNNCLTAYGGGWKVGKGDCSDSRALGWSLQGGRLSRGAASGSPMCVTRRADDTAVLARCADASEFTVLELPMTYSASDLVELKKNEVSG